MISQTSFLEDGRLDQLDIDIGRKIQPSGGWLGVYTAKALRTGYMSVQIDEQGCLPDPKVIFENKEMVPLSEEASLFLQKTCTDEFFQKNFHHLHVEGSTLFFPYAKHIEDSILSQVAVLVNAPPLVSINMEALSLETTTSSLHPEQKQAITTLASHTCSILTGGPGTGKTFTAGKWLQLLSQSSITELRIALIAPTGRAAQTLLSSISKATSNSLMCDAQTIHRLVTQSSSFFPYNVIIVDECSMIDSSLFYQMLQKIYPGTRVLFLGDPNQLPPIDPGKPFVSLVRSESSLGKASLTTSHRTDSKEILHLASFLLENGLQDITEKSGPVSIKNLSKSELELIIEEKIISPWESVREKEEALLLLQQCIILCPTRIGPLGTEKINHYIHKRRKNTSFSPIVFLKNNYDLGVMNGDLCVLEKSSPLEYVHSRERVVPATICPRYEEAFAMSIHKSQGSEFTCVILVLPKGAHLDNQLLYTAVTRAKQELIILM